MLLGFTTHSNNKQRQQQRLGIRKRVLFGAEASEGIRHQSKGVGRLAT